MRTLRIDIETYSSIDLIKCGVYKYADSKDFEILLFGYAFDDEPVRVVDFQDYEGLPEEVRFALTDETILKTAYNANFERVCISSHFGLIMDPRQWQCTAVHAAYLGLPGNLDGVAKVLGLDAQKDAAGKNLIKYFSVPCKQTKVNGGRTRNFPYHAPGKWAQYKSYCGQDVEVERAISNTLSKYPVPQSEWDMWYLDQEINDRGIKVDLQLVQNAIKCDEQYKEMLMTEAVELTGLSNPNSGAQLKAWLMEVEGLEVDSLTKGTVPQLITSCETDLAKRVLELRQELSKTSIKKYQAMERSICSDEHSHGLLQFYGANRTGRWAGRLVQVQNLPRNYLNDLELARNLVKCGDFEMLELLFGNVPDTLSQLIRTAFIPEEGERFLVADFSAIEARVIAWLAGEQWRLDVFNTHGKIYEASASQMFNIPIEEIGKGSDLRQRGKVAELALGYQGGPNALMAMGALNMGIPEGELRGLVDAWRSANTKIKKLWYDVGNAAINAVDDKKPYRLKHGVTFIPAKDWLFCELPSGRRLAYFKPKLVPGDYGAQLTYEGVNDKKQWSRLKTYGGKLVENIVQAIARDCLAESMKRLDEAGFKVRMHVHDEAIVSYQGAALDEVCEIMGQPIDWALGLPLRADGYYADFYMKD